MTDSLQCEDPGGARCSVGGRDSAEIGLRADRGRSAAEQRMYLPLATMVTLVMIAAVRATRTSVLC